MKQAIHSSSSIITTSNITYNSDDDDDNHDIQFKTQTTMNDVVAIKSND
ncbi:unnamed protein product, partial [Rotaria magnacalcarata]